MARIWLRLTYCVTNVIQDPVTVHLQVLQVGGVGHGVQAPRKRAGHARIHLSGPPRVPFEPCLISQSFSPSVTVLKKLLRSPKGQTTPLDRLKPAFSGSTPLAIY